MAPVRSADLRRRRIRRRRRARRIGAPEKSVAPGAWRARRLMQIVAARPEPRGPAGGTTATVARCGQVGVRGGKVPGPSGARGAPGPIHTTRSTTSMDASARRSATAARGSRFGLADTERASHASYARHARLMRATPTAAPDAGALSDGEESRCRRAILRSARSTARSGARCSCAGRSHVHPCRRCAARPAHPRA
jgi:hypothetical protein